MSEPKENKPVILSLHSRGNPDFPRYVISDQYLRYWTGTDWTEQHDETKALVYANSNEALKQMEKLLRVHYKDKPVHRFFAPLYIDLFTDAKVSKKELTEWLVKVTKLIMDTTQHGNGPTADSYGTCRIEYGEIKEIKGIK